MVNKSSEMYSFLLLVLEIVKKATSDPMAAPTVSEEEINP